MHDLLKSPWPYVLILAILAIFALQADFSSEESPPERIDTAAETGWDVGSFITEVEEEPKLEATQEDIDKALQTHPDRTPPSEPATLESLAQQSPKED